MTAQQTATLRNFWMRPTPTAADIEALIAELGGDAEFVRAPGAGGIVALLSQLDIARAMSLAEGVHAHLRADLPAVVAFAAETARVDGSRIRADMQAQLDHSKRQAEESLNHARRLDECRVELVEEIAAARDENRLPWLGGLYGDATFEAAEAEVAEFERSIVQAKVEAVLHLTTSPELGRYSLGF